MESILPYRGKPTVYLDQNVLDFFTKHGFGDLGQVLIKDYQVVYSDETLKEIQRSKGFEDNFLNVLKELNAKYLKFFFEQPSFTSTNLVSINNSDPYYVYKEYCENSSYNSFEHTMQQWLYKFSGGRKGDSLLDIHNEQISAFSELITSIMNNSDELPAEVRNQLLLYTKEMTFQYDSTLKQTKDMMLENIEDDENWNGIKDFRACLEIGPKQLNNIEPPNVLIKIFDTLKTLPSFNQADIDIEDFFQLKQNPIYPDRPYFKHEKVTSIYNMLNTLGYYPDSNVHKERRFIAAVSDNRHASIASFCNYLLSNDEHFIKKVSAVYEYLEIPTSAEHIELIHTE